MSTYTSIIEIYDRLVTVSDELHEAKDPLERGFNACLLILHDKLKELDNINLHVENRNLKKKIHNLECAIDRLDENKHDVFIENKALKIENMQLKAHVKSIKSNQQIKAKVCSNMNKVEIDFETRLINFYINTDQINFDRHFIEASNYVFSRRKKSSHNAAVTNWFIQYYRGQGFTCLSKI